MRLEDVARVFGGQIRQLRDRRWLDTRVHGLRTLVIPRVASGGGLTFELAVFTLHTRELDPFFSRAIGDAIGEEEWLLDNARVVPPLSGGFLYAGCHRGILFATSTREPSLENIVGALWDLAGWARKPWHPPEGSSEAELYRASARRQVWRDRLLRLTWVVLVVALVLYWRSDDVAERVC